MFEGLLVLVDDICDWLDGLINVSEYVCLCVCISVLKL